MKVEIVWPLRLPKVSRVEGPASDSAEQSEVPVDAAPTMNHAPRGRKLFISLSGTQRTDWKLQLAFYAAAVFSVGAVAGWAVGSR